MSNITALLHRAAISGLTIYFDDVAECTKMWPVKAVDPALLKELDAHSNEIVHFLRDARFFGCCCPDCRTTVH